MGQIRSFKGEVFNDNQYVEEFEDFSEESDTFYSEYYNYDSIITIENDSEWINFWLIVECHLQLVKTIALNNSWKFLCSGAGERVGWSL